MMIIFFFRCGEVNWFLHTQNGCSKGIAAESAHRTLSCLGPRTAASVIETKISACPDKAFAFQY